MEDNKDLENQNTNTGESTNNAEGTGNVDTQTTNQNEGQAEKTFTQEELNKIVQERLDKEKKKMPSKEDLKAFKDWKESQKTAEEKQAEKEAEYQKTLNELNTLKQTNAVLEAGVNKDDVDYVLFKVSKMEGNFDENLTKFLKDNPMCPCCATRWTRYAPCPGTFSSSTICAATTTSAGAWTTPG